MRHTPLSDSALCPRDSESGEARRGPPGVPPGPPPPLELPEDDQQAEPASLQPPGTELAAETGVAERDPDGDGDESEDEMEHDGGQGRRRRLGGQGWWWAGEVEATGRAGEEVVASGNRTFYP